LGLLADLPRQLLNQTLGMLQGTHKGLQTEREFSRG
jgi:hypothetical protein